MDKRDNKAVNIHTFNDYRGYQKYRGVLTIEQMSRAHQELRDGMKTIKMIVLDVVNKVCITYLL